MKRLLILLIFSVNIFSQTNHSSLKLDCSFCHDCEKPTKLNPCLKSCPRDEMITVYHSAEKTPNIININVVKSEKDIYQKVEFTHRLHAEMSNMAGGCVICHHYNPPGKVIACRECHENNRIRGDLNKPDLKGAYHRQCLTCHKTWTAQDDCNFCHLPNGVTKKSKTNIIKSSSVHKKIDAPTKLLFKSDGYKNSVVTFYHNDHSDVFNLECTKCHNSDACAKCHNTNLVKKNLNKTKIDKHSICSSCHNVKTNCEYCHKETEAERFNHLKSAGFELKSYHSSLQCQKCHKNGKDYSGLNKTCSNCHSTWDNNFNHGKTGLMLNEVHADLSCEDCHDVVTMKISCSNCHDENFYPKNLPGKRIKK